MKKLCHLVLSFMLSFSLYSPASAQNPFDPQPGQNSELLVKYLLNFGAYLGYDLKQSPYDTGSTTSQQQQLINPTVAQTAEVFLVNAALGAMPVNAVSSLLSAFVPTDSNSSFTIFNPLANLTFNNYNSPSAQQGTVSVSNLIDQPNYQQDPVSQAVFDILGTPDSTFCMDSDATTFNPNCKLLYREKVMANAIGKIPGTSEFFTFQYLQPFLAQLNSNTLMSPMLYSVNGGATSTSSSQPTQNGLVGQSQAQQAANFIRYAAGGVNPIALPRYKDYDKLYGVAMNTGNDSTLTQQLQAQGQLATYLTDLRAYAAQASVAVGNLYYILSKRMPQKLSDKTDASSQALSEFNMATWRLFNSDKKSSNTQWLNQINQASSVTVEKEMAVLLAEINYQLYLNRQQQERILLTETMILMQNTKAAKPIASSLIQQSAGQGKKY